MSVYRCNQCAFVAEDLVTPVGSKVACARCATPTSVFATVFYVEKLLERYFAALREVKVMKQANDANSDTPIEPKAASGGQLTPQANLT